MSAEGECEGEPVDLYIYDLTQGLASLLSPAIMGRQIEGVWHTSIVVFGREYYYGGGGIACAPIGGTMAGRPREVQRLGRTQVPAAVFREYLQGLAATTFAGEAYQLLEHNCNHFTDEVAQFLCGARVPKHIVRQPDADLPPALRQALAELLGGARAQGPTAGGVRYDRQDSPDYLTLNTQIEEARATSAALEARRSTLADKLARKERRKEKKRRKHAGEPDMAEAVPLPSEAAAPAPSPSPAPAPAPAPAPRARAGPSADDGEEPRRCARDPPITFTDIDGAQEFAALQSAVASLALSGEEQQSLGELEQYLVHGEGSWALGDDFLAFIGRLLGPESTEAVRVAALRCVAAMALREDVSLLLHQDRRSHALMNYAQRVDRLPPGEQLALARALCNLFENVSSSEWLLYISEWDLDGQPVSNIRITTKVAVHATLGEDAELRDVGTAIMYNMATKEVKTVRLSAGRALRDLLPRHAKSKVFDDVSVELAMALLQLLAQAPGEEQLYRAVAALARLAHHSAEVAQLVALVGPPPAAFRGTSPRCDEKIDLIMQKQAGMKEQLISFDPTWDRSPRPLARRGSSRRSHADTQDDQEIPASTVQEEGTPFPSHKAGGGWRRGLERRVPLLSWAPRYCRLAAAADLVAGITLGLTLVPQSIAYAALAGLPVHYGLYSSFMGTMLYMVFGTVKEVSIGPTSLMALLVLQSCHGLPIQYVTLLAFLSGAVVMLMGLLRLGFLVDLISPSVTSGFTSGTAVIIVVTQLKGLLGLSFTAESIPENFALIVQKWDKVQVPDVLLSLVCCTVLLLLRKLKDVEVGPKRAGLKRALWLLSISRNALVVSGAAFYAYHACDHDKPFIKLSGHVTPGLPPLSLPAFSLQGGNNSTVGFLEMVQELGSAVIMMPIVMVLANIAIAKAFTSGGRVDATQEMLTLGVCNMAGALVHAMPTCGAFTRSAVSHSSGVQTPAAGLYSGIIVLLALRFMTHYFKFIPKACLSSVLICAVIFMVDLGTVQRLWRTCRAELAVLLLTFAVCLADSVERAVLVGVLAATAVLLRGVMRPAVHRHQLQVGGAEATRVRPTLALIFLNVEHVSARLVAAARARPHAPVLLDCSALSLIDDASRQALERLVKKFKSVDQKLIAYNSSPEVLKSLEAVEGLDKRALGAVTALDALTAIVDTGDHHIIETTALLEKK